MNTIKIETYENVVTISNNNGYVELHQNGNMFTVISLENDLVKSHGDFTAITKAINKATSVLESKKVA